MTAPAASPIPAAPARGSSSTTSRGRRRQRSVRGVFATGLVVLGAGLLGAGWLVSADAADPAAGRLRLLAGAVAGLVLAAAAARVVWREVLDTRRWAAYERARQTERHARELGDRVAEHTVVVQRLTARRAAAEQESARLRRRVRELTHELTHGLSRGQRSPHPDDADGAHDAHDAHDAALASVQDELARTREALSEARRLATSSRQQAEALRAEVIRLQDALVEQQAEESDELASWEGEEPAGVVRLASWSERRLA